MKKVLLAVLASLFISIIIPLIIVELAEPKNNADSTKPLPSPEVSAEEMQV